MKAWVKQNKGFCIAVLALLLAVLLAGLGLWLGDFPVETASPEKGSGHLKDPYVISSVGDLYALRDEVLQGNSFAGAYFMQTADLDFEGEEPFIPIGTAETPFAGYYNGGGHVIKNMQIYSVNEVAAPFAYLGEGAVYNLGVEGGYFEGRSTAGVVGISRSETDKILNCYSTATLNGMTAGGVVLETPGTVSHCFFAGKNESVSFGGISGNSSASVLYSSAAPICAPEAAIRNAYGNTEIRLTAEQLTSAKERFVNGSQLYLSPDTQLFRLYYEEEGSKNDPFRIYTAEELCAFRALVDAGCSFVDLWVRQEADLDLSAIENFKPIGDPNTGAFFWGTYDGGGHVLTDLNIVYPGQNVGLFYNLAGRVLNLGLESGRVEGECIGSFTSHLGSSNVEIFNCYSRLTMAANGRVGGIADNAGGAIIANCYFAGTVERAAFVGGIVSYTAERVENCYSYGADPFSPYFDLDYNGFAPVGVSRVDSAAKAAKAANRSLYGSATGQDMQGVDLYRFDADGGFGGTALLGLSLLWRELLVGVALAVAVAALLIGWYSARRKRRIPLCEVRTAIVGKWRQLSADTDSRMRLLIGGLFAFSAVMTVLGFLCGDKWIFNAAIYSYGEDAYMDFFNPLRTLMNNNYRVEGHYTDVGGSYPPVARFFLWIFGSMLPAGTVAQDSFSIRNSSYGQLIFLLVFLGSLALVYVAFTKQGEKGKGKYLLPLFIVGSAPTLYLFERGNVLMLAFLFSTLFVAGYRSENAVIRHLSYLSLGLAAAIKIYPVVLGLLVLKEKNKQHITECIAWGFACCFLPFAFCGGITSLELYIRNITVSTGKNTIGTLMWLMNYSNMFAWIANMLFGSSAIPTARLIAKYTLPLLVALLIGCFFLSKHRWKDQLALILVLILVPGYSVYYMCVFYCIPMAAFLWEKHTEKKDWVYAVLLTLTLLPLAFLCGCYGWTEQVIRFAVGISGIALSFFMIGETVYVFFKEKTWRNWGKKVADAEAVALPETVEEA